MKIDLYWGAMYFALFICVLYNLVTSHKYGIKRWKFIIITLVAFVYNWGVSYIAAWIEAGFQTPPTVNGIRSWIFAPFYFLLCSFIFNIDFKRLSDAITPCFMLGFSIGHIGCAYAGCCNGYPYNGPFAIWNRQLEYYCFPIQIVECIICFCIFLGFYIYIKKSNYKITGKQYPVMLIFYIFRVFTELFRDNEKVFWRVSPLVFHAIAGCIVGLIWFYFMTAHGKRLIAKIKKFMFKNSDEVLSLEQYSNIIEKKQKLLNIDSYENDKENSRFKICQITKNDFNKERRIIITAMEILLWISSIVGILCIYWLNRPDLYGMKIFLVKFFLILCAISFIYSIITIIRLIKCKKNAISQKKTICFLYNPINHKFLMSYNGNYYYIAPQNCSHCGKKSEFDLISSKKIRCSCLTSMKHAIMLDEKYIENKMETNDN